MKVLIINSNVDYRRMFENAGWELLPGDAPVEEADLVQFTGGEDVSPWLYGEPPHRYAHNNWERDKSETVAFGLSVRHNIPVAGICRGAQFLNVMCGGKLWQHVDGHTTSHVIRCMDTDTTFEATSTHHQMMRPGPGSVVIGIAEPRCATFKQDGWMLSDGRIEVDGLNAPDYEIVFYPTERALCFQPHPEFQGHEELAKRYFDYLDRCLGVKAT